MTNCRNTSVRALVDLAYRELWLDFGFSPEGGEAASVRSGLDR